MEKNSRSTFLGPAVCFTLPCLSQLVKCVCMHVCAQSCPALCDLHGLQPIRLLCPWDFSVRDAGVGCHFLLYGVFPTQGSNPVLPHCRWILYHLSYQGSNIHLKTRLSSPSLTSLTMALDVLLFLFHSM